MIVMKYATASTANARQRCTSVLDSVFIATSFTSLVACRRVDPPCLEVVIRQTAGIHRSQNVLRSSLRRQVVAGGHDHQEPGRQQPERPGLGALRLGCVATPR